MPTNSECTNSRNGTTLMDLKSSLDRRYTFLDKEELLMYMTEENCLCFPHLCFPNTMFSSVQWTF